VLAKLCQGGHDHEVPSGSVYSEKHGRWISRTSLAAEYPRELCDAYAAAIMSGPLGARLSQAPDDFFEDNGNCWRVGELGARLEVPRATVKC
jgi:hypothetical protein